MTRSTLFIVPALFMCVAACDQIDDSDVASSSAALEASIAPPEVFVFEPPTTYTEVSVAPDATPTFDSQVPVLSPSSDLQVTPAVTLPTLPSIQQPPAY